VPPAVWTRLPFARPSMAGARSVQRQFVQPILLALFVLTAGPAPHARAADQNGTLFEIPVPGGLKGALAAIDDPLPADRSLFLLEFIRRFYQTPVGTKGDPRDAALQALFGYLDRPSAAAGTDTVPLPLSPALWTNTVFKGSVTTDALVPAIVRSRNASLLYYGLLSLDEATREWIAGRPELIAQIVTHQAPAFAVAAPALRVDNGIVRVPGGDAADPAWQALVGKRRDEPVEFLRALLSRDEGRLALLYSSLAVLPPERIRFMLKLDASDASVRVDAARRVLTIFQRLTATWNIEERTFARPSIDPALLAADLRVDADGRPRVPGSRAFWTAALAESEQAASKTRPDESASSDSVDFAWLCEEVFRGDQTEQRRRYYAVLFASRSIDRITPDNSADALDVVKAVGSYPALIAAFERAKVSDLASMAKAARRAAALSTIGDDAHAARAFAQFQGTLALMTRASLRGSLPGAALPALITSLSAIETTAHGDYEGRISRWIDDHLRELAGGGQRTTAPTGSDVEVTTAADLFDDATGVVDRDLVRLLTGRADNEPRFIDWEGTRYRVDFVTTEGMRLARVLGEHPEPHMTSARTLLDAADAMEAPNASQDTVRHAADALDRIGQGIDWTTWDSSDVQGRYRDASSVARRAEGRNPQGLASSLRLLADDFAARGLTELAYAAALGQGDGGAVLAAEAASRHDFGTKLASSRRATAWRVPIAGAGTSRGWHVGGALLGLDVGLADFALIRMSSKPPTRRPTLNEDDRRAFIDVVALIDPAALGDDTAGAIVDAMRRGRARVDAATSLDQLLAIADEIRLSPVRRTLLAWVAVHDRTRIGAFLSPLELFWAGLDNKPIAPSVQAWGALGSTRLGCLCLDVLDRRPWETLSGRWSSGMFASGFPDLNLRLTELLGELRMPASLLAPVLASATLDFVNSAVSRDQDDRRGLVEFVRALRADKVEQYLALLTTDGPLLPVSQTAQPNTKAGVSR
jgi:hypothetical protein